MELKKSDYDYDHGYDYDYLIVDELSSWVFFH